jgi:cation diffusion facilitator family transporter
MAAGGSNKAIMAALVANLGIAVTKFVAFLLTTSTAMLAESVHSVADTGNQALLILGGKRAARDETPDHPFGHGRERYFWAFVVAIILFSLGSLFAIYEAIHKMQHPEPIGSPAIALGTLAIGIVLETFSFRTAIVEARHVKAATTSWADFIRRSKSPELPVVLLEDAGALAGLVFAFGAVATAAVTGNGIWDGVGSLVIGLLLGVIAIVLAVEMKSLLIGEVAAPEQEDTIRRLIESGDNVRSLIWLRTQHLGPDELLVAAKIEFDTSLDVPGLARAIDDVEARVRAEVPIAEYLFIEPDVRRAARSGGGERDLPAPSA